MLSTPDPGELRARLAEARVMLIFTPSLAQEPLAALEACLPWVDLIQVRPKPLGDAAPGASLASTSAREAHDWCRRVLDLLGPERTRTRPVLVNDRVDVAANLWPQGLAGVHVGQDDCPAAGARQILGPGPLIGLSTHTAAELAAAHDVPVDYLGFGPIFSTETKGYGQGLGPERAWVAQSAAPVPLFAIGGIDATNVVELGEVGRVAVGSAVLAARDPERAARELRESLESGESLT